MRDPYTVLGVPRSASEAEVKKAWRKLAKKVHPDHNRDDPQAAAKLTEVNQAYEILGDKEKRAKFDRGEIDAEGKPRFEAYEGFTRGNRGGFNTFEFEFGAGRGRGPGRTGPDVDPNEFFTDLFGAMGGNARNRARDTTFAKGRDATATVTVDFVDAARGTTRRVQLPTGKVVDVTIPPATETRTTMRLRGQGFPAPGGGEAGDALLTVEVTPHPILRAEGRDLRLDMPITLDEAVLGARVRVPTLDGPVELSVPSGSSSGRTLRLKGKGIPAPEGPGDLYVRLEIVLPEGDATLSRLAEDIRSNRPYGVRGPEFEH